MSHILLMHLICIAVIFMPMCDDAPSRLEWGFVKIALLLLARARCGPLRYGQRYATMSLAVLIMYAWVVDLSSVYGCTLRVRSLAHALAVSLVVYAALARWDGTTSHVSLAKLYSP